MPSKHARKRTDAESQAFKAKIVGLRGKGKSMTEIAQELGITKQYASLVLNEVGLGGKLVRDTPIAKVQARRDYNDEVQAAIAQLKRQGDYALADNLRVMLERRTSAIELRKANRRANRKSI
jgi:predicted transcriptional regulator